MAAPKTGTPVGVQTLKKSHAAGGGSGNKPATQQWHQGFGTIRMGQVQVVPFAYRATAERIAQQAEKNTKTAMQVRKFRGLWVYLPGKG